MSSVQLKNQHLLWRAGFGPAAGQSASLQKLSPSRLYQSLKEASAKQPMFLDATGDDLKSLARSLQTTGMRQLMEKEDRRTFQQQTRRAVRNLNLLWLDEMVHSGAQLREKMAFFLAWTFCGTQPQCILPAATVACYSPACAGLFSRPAARSFQKCSHA